MTMLPLILKAAGFGLAVAAPVGPMSLLCMRRTLALGWRQGLATGFGIATGDGLYAAVAALGLAGVAAFLFAHERGLHAGAGVLLLWLGVAAWRAGGEERPAEAPGEIAWPAAYAGAVALTLANPPTIITFAAIFTALAPPGGFAAGAAAATVGGVFAGSALWWCGIVGGVTLARHALGERTKRWIDRIAGLVFIGFGLLQLAQSL
jgi:threonine/homoserine/homoserine lactone efflux protein